MYSYISLQFNYTKNEDFCVLQLSSFFYLFCCYFATVPSA